MNGRERIHAIFDRKQADRVGFWAGDPTEETREIYNKYFHVGDPLSLSAAIGDDAVWLFPERKAYKHPEGKPLWDYSGGNENRALDGAGVFAGSEKVSEIDAFDWPDPDYLDFTSTLETIDKIHELGMAVFSGPWTYISTLATDFFGMENLFTRMYTHPAVVQAAVDHLVDFYLVADRKFFELAGDKLDVFFFASDLGGQDDLLMSPELFRRFFLPGFRKVVGQAKTYGHRVMMHSCGAISRIIPDLISIGIDALHPLQARARGMEAQRLAREFGRDLVFVGGVDTQALLPFGSPEQVKAEVRRLKRVFGERFIVSPSHEGVLPNVSPENMLAMRDAALE